MSDASEFKEAMVYVRKGKNGGVELVAGNPNDPNSKMFVVKLQPQWAREVAQRLTLCSFEVEDDEAAGE